MRKDSEVFQKDLAVVEGEGKRAADKIKYSQSTLI